MEKWASWSTNLPRDLARSWVEPISLLPAKIAEMQAQVKRPDPSDKPFNWGHALGYNDRAKVSGAPTERRGEAGRVKRCLE
jgi:hypothetical protein